MTARCGVEYKTCFFLKHLDILFLPPSLPPSLRKPTRGIQYLVRESVLEDRPQSVASFLTGEKGLSKEKIGEFVGEINSEFHMAVLE